MMSFKSCVAAAAGLALLSACGGGGTGTVTNLQQNSTPTGFIEGRVLDASSAAPIAGATVSLYANGAVTATTDANGRYRLGPIPAGSTYTIFVELEGYVKRMFFIGLNGAAGNYPIGNVVVTQDLDMAPATAGIDGQVLTNNGRVAANATVFLDLRNDNFDLVISAKTDMNGKFTMTGLPGAAEGLNVTVIVPPFDDNADGLPDYNSGARNLNLFPGFNTPATVNINAVNVSVVTSNIADGEILPTSPITIDFTTPIDAMQSTFTLVDSNVGYVVATIATWASSTKLTLTPVGGPLTEGSSYYVQYQVRGVNGATTNNTLSFTATAGPGAPPTGVVTNFKITVPAMAMYDSTQGFVTVTWDQLPMAAGYRIYGKDTLSNQAYLRISNAGMGSGQTNVSLAIFDAITTDAYNTPLAYGNRVKLAIVPIDNNGNEAALATAATVELADTVAPKVDYGQVISGTANNTGGTMPVTLVYRVSFSEPMSQTTTPTVTFQVAGLTSTWMWISPVQANVTITVPAGANGTGMITIAAAKDSSNIAQTLAYSGSLY